ncbi:MAG TPA: hypothetical protein VKC64_16020 [Burkholderiales bacterium]|nr:hypothetical protein [Burkholderiales bacterium]
MRSVFPIVRLALAVLVAAASVSAVAADGDSPKSTPDATPKRQSAPAAPARAREGVREEEKKAFLARIRAAPNSRVSQ